MKITAYSTFMLLLATAIFADTTEKPKFQHRLIKNHGGIVVLPKAAHQPKKDSTVLIDITKDDKAGAGFDNGFKMAIILHGSATKAALSHEAYAKHANPYSKDLGKTKNPNAELINKLKQAGVQIFVCGQAMAHHGYASSEVSSDVTVAVSAATVNINLQTEGYAYIPFK